MNEAEEGHYASHWDRGLDARRLETTTLRLSRDNWAVILLCVGLSSWLGAVYAVGNCFVILRLKSSDAGDSADIPHARL